MHILKMLSVILLCLSLREITAQTAQPEVRTAISSLAFSPDGSLLAVATGADSGCLGEEVFRIQLINLTLTSEEWLLGQGCPLLSLDFNSDGTKLVVSDSGTHIGSCSE